MKPTTRLILCATAAIALLATACSTTTANTPKTAQTSHMKAYPLKVCLVSGNTLDSMGDTVTEVYNDQEVKFCCTPCVKKFHANPDKYLQKLR